MKIIEYGRIYLSDDGKVAFSGFNVHAEGAQYETLSGDIDDVDFEDSRFQRDLLCEIIRLHLTGEQPIELRGELAS